MASNPKKEYQVFLCIFQKKSAMAISKTKTTNRADFFPYLPKGIFPFTSNLRQPLAIADFFWKMQRKTWYSIFPKNFLSGKVCLKMYYLYCSYIKSSSVITYWDFQFSYLNNLTNRKVFSSIWFYNTKHLQTINKAQAVFKADKVRIKNCSSRGNL